MEGWSGGYLDEFVSFWVTERLDGCMDGWLEEWMESCCMKNGCVALGGLVGWMNAWMDG